MNLVFYNYKAWFLLNFYDIETFLSDILFRKKSTFLCKFINLFYDKYFYYFDKISIFLKFLL
jgi:hypothetical protein